MSKLHEARLKLWGELEAPPALRRFGSGWISGVLGLELGLAGFSLVLALRMPGTFSIPETHGLYANPWFRIGLQVSLLAAFALSALSLALRVYLYSTFVDANLNWRFPIIEKLLVKPRFHLWHHGIENEAVDVNFAIHFPVLDKLFGTYHLPKDQWPPGDGVQDHPVPLGYLARFKYPFQRKKVAD